MDPAHLLRRPPIRRAAGGRHQEEEAAGRGAMRGNRLAHQGSAKSRLGGTSTSTSQHRLRDACRRIEPRSLSVGSPADPWDANAREEKIPPGGESRRRGRGPVVRAPDGGANKGGRRRELVRGGSRLGQSCSPRADFLRWRRLFSPRFLFRLALWNLDAGRPGNHLRVPWFSALSHHPATSCCPIVFPCCCGLLLLLWPHGAVAHHRSWPISFYRP
jgi:hypothetical protein